MSNSNVGSASQPLPNGLTLNIGCGPVQPEGWVNIDGSNRAWLASRLSVVDKSLVKLGVLSPTEFGPHITIHNLFKPLPFANNSAACVYAGEVWEHFEYDDTVRLTALFEQVGFVNVGRMPFHQSRIPDVSKVERSDFCIVEGSKPS